MKRIASWALAMTLTLGLFAPGVAEAHVKTFDTNLTLNVSDRTPDRGDRVVFRGKLSSPNSRCVRNQTIRIYRNGNLFATTQTNDRGRYRIRKAVRRSGRYQARFAGFGPFGTHPHSHNCRPSRSNTVRIRVQ